MKEIITAVVLFIMAAGAFAIGARSFQEKGYLLNNAYFYASKQERDRMDKKPYYRQSGVVFFLLGVVLLFIALGELLNCKWVFQGMIAMIALTIIYAIASTIWIEMKKRG